MYSLYYKPKEGKIWCLHSFPTNRQATAIHWWLEKFNPGVFKFKIEKS